MASKPENQDLGEEIISKLEELNRRLDYHLNWGIDEEKS